MVFSANAKTDKRHLDMEDRAGEMRRGCAAAAVSRVPDHCLFWFSSRSLILQDVQGCSIKSSSAHHPKTPLTLHLEFI